MTLLRRLARVEREVLSERQEEWSHFFEGVTVPATGDRLEFLKAELARALALGGDALDPRDAMSMLTPLFGQLTLDELRELSREPLEPR